MAKFSELIDQTRDGHERPEDERQLMRAALASMKCSHCGELALCFYYIQIDAVLCSDECRASYGAQSLTQPTETAK